MDQSQDDGAAYNNQNAQLKAFHPDLFPMFFFGRLVRQSLFLGLPALQDLFLPEISLRPEDLVERRRLIVRRWPFLIYRVAQISERLFMLSLRDGDLDAIA